MKKEEIIRRVAQKTWLSQRCCEDVTEAFLTEITNALECGESVQLRGFGTFSPKQRAARTGRNPHTGEAVPIPPRRVAVFKPAFFLSEKKEVE